MEPPTIPARFILFEVDALDPHPNAVAYRLLAEYVTSEILGGGSPPLYGAPSK